MFKKPLSDLKTSAPLRSSDRRKLKQRVVETFSLQPEDGDVVVPEGLRSTKFSTHLGEPGLVYLSQEGDPLWFTVGKGSDELIPTVYTLWKQRNMLPFLSTPSQVIPILVGGADLMAPGVVQYSTTLAPDQLVSITQYYPGNVGPPLAVGRMAIPTDALRAGDTKGKAVYVLHTWNDKLWEMGKGKETSVPEPLALEANGVKEVDGDEEEGTDGRDADAEGATTDVQDNSADGTVLQEKDAQPTDGANDEAQNTLTPQEVSALLRTALLQSINSTLSKLPPSAFPMPASTFNTTHLLPSRLAHPVFATPVDIKHSTHKNLGAFLKLCEKEGLITLKQSKGDVLLAGVSKNHPEVLGHRSYRTMQQDSEKLQKKEAREKDEEDRRRGKAREMTITEFWKPHQTTLRFFEEAGKDLTALYTHQELKAVFLAYIAAKSLANPNDQSYLNLGSDNVLLTSLGSPAEEFMKRDEVFRRLLDRMQLWHEIRVEGKDRVLKKGALKPIAVIVKIRQGRKACTLITGFELYSIVADDLAEELRRACASSTAVAPLQGKNAGLEVMVQGKQITAVCELLMGKGVPKKWIEGEDQTEKKKK